MHAQQRKQLLQQGIAKFKLKPKKGELPADITYIAGEHVPPAWNCYPWDAQAYGRDVFAHEALARRFASEISDEPPTDLLKHYYSMIANWLKRRS